LAFITRTYHNAQYCECQIRQFRIEVSVADTLNILRSCHSC